MKCADLEALICDYVDATLSPAERATVELHLASCASCRELVELSRSAVDFMERAAEPEPPAAMLNQILFEARKAQAGTAKAPWRSNWVARLLEPLLQPKFAMGMAMTILSFSMLGRLAGIPQRELRVSDLEPARVWTTLEDKAYRAWDRAKKYYESLRFVYEIREALNDWSEGDEASGAIRPSGSAPGAAPAKAPAAAPPANPSAPEGRDTK